MDEDNLTYPDEELIPNIIKDSIARKPSVELIDGSNIPALEENGCNISASEENITNVSLPEGNNSSISDSNDNAKDLVAGNISNKAVSEVYLDDTKITEEILENDAKDDGVQESPVDDQVPILVPGLPPTATASNQNAPPHEVEDDGSVCGINESNDHKLPEVTA